jgi:hypothetical protein
MQTNVIFENVKAYNVDKIDVKLNESFKIELIDTTDTCRWFFDNDPALDVIPNENGAEASIKATGIGNCEIQLQSNGVVVKVIQISVYDNAASLNPTVGKISIK